MYHKSFAQGSLNFDLTFGKIIKKTDYKRINSTHFRSDSNNAIIGSSSKDSTLPDTTGDCHRNEFFKIRKFYFFVE